MQVFNPEFIKLLDDNLQKIVEKIPAQTIIEFLKQRSSKFIGQVGELSIENIFNDINDISIKRTSEIPRSGDFTITWKDIKILLEVKNYSNSIPMEEIQKFFRDVEYQGYMGLMISNIKFVKYGDFEFIENPPCILVNTNDKNIIRLCAKFLFSYKLHSKVIIDSGVADILSEMKEKMVNFSRIRNSVLNLEKTIHVSLMDINNELMKLETFFDNSINKALSLVNKSTMFKGDLSQLEQMNYSDNAIKLFRDLNFTISEDKKTITAGKITVVKLTNREKVTITVDEFPYDLPYGEFSYKDNKLTYYLLPENVDYTKTLNK